MFEKSENPGPCRGVSQSVRTSEPLGVDPLTPEQATHPTIVRRGLKVLGVRGCVYAVTGNKFVECKAGIGKAGSSSEILPTCLHVRVAINPSAGVASEEFGGSKVI